MIRFFWFLLSTAMSALLLLLTIAVCTVLYFSSKLPDHRKLEAYFPPMMSRVYAADGQELAGYAEERRIFIPIEMIPKTVIHAFITAEDRQFFLHRGLDFKGIIRAMLHNFKQAGSGGNIQGASTITQQVAKNILLGNTRSLERKIREAILAYRMSEMFSKDRILELYLNEIYLGAGAYGISQASLEYFNKPVQELTPAEAALLAALPAAPSAYNPHKNYKKALERRNWVLNGMVEEGYLSREEADAAIKTEIVTEKRKNVLPENAGYFSDEARQIMWDRFGRKALNSDGLSIHTTLDIKLQRLAEAALKKGLIDYDKRHGYRGGIGHIDLSTWQESLNRIVLPKGAEGLQLAVVLRTDPKNKRYEIGLKGGIGSYLTSEGIRWAVPAGKKASDLLIPGQVILVEPVSNKTTPYMLRQMPLVEGALIAMDPKNGKILAMVGGYSYDRSQFNRATQAKRQPGSAFKPFIYLAALEHGYRPSDLIADEPIQFVNPYSKPDSPMAVWSPENYSGNFYGPTSLRKGVEKSINVMTVHLTLILGLEKVKEIGKRLGIYEKMPNEVSIALGAVETTLLDLVKAYATIASGGKKISPQLIERIHDRNGNIMYRRDNRKCEGCNVLSDEEKLLAIPPALEESSEIVVDPKAAYQMTSILEGVTIRGTAKAASSLNRVVAGKTGTTNDSRDAWFIGYSPELVVGVFVGFDSPKPLGDKESGASLALPIFIDFMKEALAKVPSTPFPVPEGIHFVKIDGKTGFLPSPQSIKEDILTEAYVAGTEPTRALSKTERPPVLTASESRRKSVIASEPVPIDDNPALRGTGGFY